MQKKYTEEHLYGIALCKVFNIGNALSRQLLSYCGSAEKVFKLSKPRLQKIPGIGPVIAEQILSANVLREAEEEMRFIEKNEVEILFYYDKRYPQRLLHCNDAPFVLFAKGNFDFNVSRIVNIVGTRHATDYGKQITETLVDELSSYDFTLVSGLAFGIDVAAHRAALKNNLQNIAVLGHGLDRIYPWQHRYTAEKLLDNGGLLTDFMSGTNPDRQNFPERNRIVAGMTDATIVIESAVAGGALITAEIANSYNRDVFAIPGKVNDEFSRGCNELIRQNKAQLITSAEDIAKALFWDMDTKQKENEKTNQATLFPELSGDAALVYHFIREQGKVHMDKLTKQLPVKTGSMAAALLELEMLGLIQSKPGNMYSLV
jgi:DNA processing protein